MRGYYNLVEGMWRLGRLHQGRGSTSTLPTDYSRDRDFPVHRYMIQARRHRLLAMYGEWSEAVAGFAALLDGRADTGHDRPRDHPDPRPATGPAGTRRRARACCALAREHAERADVLEWLVTTGHGLDRVGVADGPPCRCRALPGAPAAIGRTGPGCPVQRAELLRYLHRLGHEVGRRRSAGCPEGYAAGIAG